MIEIRPCFGPVEPGDPLVCNEFRTHGFFTVRRARPDEQPLAHALGARHALGFVAIERVADRKEITT
jgi:hypothetical protein